MTDRQCWLEAGRAPWVKEAPECLMQASCLKAGLFEFGRMLPISLAPGQRGQKEASRITSGTKVAMKTKPV